MAFYLYRSNRLENLAELFGERIYSRPPDDRLLAGELVGVPSSGIAAYLQQFLSDKYGIAANLEFPFPAALADHLLAALLDDAFLEQLQRDRRYFKVEVMTWKLHALIADIAPRYPELDRYLRPASGGDDPDMRCHHVPRLPDFAGLGRYAHRGCSRRLARNVPELGW